MEGDQDLVVVRETGIEGQDLIAEIGTDGGGQDRVVKRDVDEHRDPVVRIEEVATVPHQGSTEDHLQDEGLKNCTLYTFSALTIAMQLARILVK